MVIYSRSITGGNARRAEQDPLRLSSFRDLRSSRSPTRRSATQALRLVDKSPALYFLLPPALPIVASHGQGFVDDSGD